MQYNIKKVLFLLAILTLSSAFTCTTVHAGNKEKKYSQNDARAHNPKVIIAGYVETVSLSINGHPTPISIEAKLDTGADSSSLHVTDLTMDEEKKLVSFTLPYGEAKGTRITCPYQRIVRIKKRPSGYQRRPVIRVQLQIGRREFDADVNLTNRNNFKYKMLIGRKQLRHGILIDSSRHHRLSRPTAPQKQ